MRIQSYTQNEITEDLTQSSLTFMNNNKLAHQHVIFLGL